MAKPYLYMYNVKKADLAELILRNWEAKDKDKEALFNVAYNEQTTITHELFCDITIISLTDTYLPYFIFLAQPLLCERL